MDYGYTFTEADIERAAEEWGCNCGPSALAFAAQTTLSAVRGMIPEFEKRGYTSPTMMKKGIENLGFGFNLIDCPQNADALGHVLSGGIALVRIQWTGPWTRPGANPRWAYKYTHWLCGWIANVPLIFREKDDNEPVDIDPGLERTEKERVGDVVISRKTAVVFDINGGMMSLAQWSAEIVPILTGQYKRADGGWYPTHVWQLSSSTPS